MLTNHEYFGKNRSFSFHYKLQLYYIHRFKVKWFHHLQFLSQLFFGIQENFEGSFGYTWLIFIALPAMRWEGRGIICY